MMRAPLPLLLLTLLTACGSGPDGFGVGADDDDGTGADDDDATSDDDDDSAQPDDDDSAQPGDDDDSADPYVEPDVFVSPQDFEAGDTIVVHYRGGLAEQDGVGIRFGFDGYTQIEGVEEYLAEYVDGANRYFLEAEMIAGTDEHTYDLEVPVAARAIQMTFFVTDDKEVRTYDDREGLGYHQQVLFPYVGPLLAWTDEAQPGTGVVVTFETSMPCRGTVEYGTTEALGQRAMGGEAGYVHHVALVDLPPDTDIHYRVLDNVGHASAIHRYHTPPAGAGGSWSFAVVSDAQDHGDGSQSWGAVAASIAGEHDDLTCLLLAGDLTAEDEAGDWWTFLDGGRALFATTPVVAALGNNDIAYSTDLEDSTFARYLPRPDSSADGFVYRVDVRDAAFLTLDSELEDGFGEEGDQRAWIDGELEAIASAGEPSWVFAQWHVPAYDVGSRTNETSQLQLRPATEAFEGQLDWVFCGHEHLAQRLYPMRYDGQLAPSGAYGRGAEDGVGYMVLPPAGTYPRTSVASPEGDQAHYRDWLAFPELGDEDTTVASELGWAHVTLDGDTISLEIYGVGLTGSLVTPYVRDEISYTRP